MGSRIAATVIVILGVGALAWVVLGSGGSESASEPVVTATTSSSAASTNAAADSGETTEETSAQPDEASNDNVSSASASDAGEADGPEPTPEPAIPAPENFGARMDLVELDGWLNTDATSIDDFNGQVLLVEMWTFGCHNCKARIPHNQSYYEEFADENFEIIGVHAPEFSFEAEVPNIIEAAERLGVTWPIALDTNKLNFRAWQPGRTNFWPRTYVIDQNGDIRFDHIGEGKYDEVRETIRYLIENPPPPPAAQ